MRNQTETMQKTEPLDEYTKCSNCLQKIKTSKMFLHEGFCLRNNIYCPKCKKVILKQDYEKHLINNCNKSKNAKYKKFNLVIKNITEEDKNNQQPIMLNQINYNSCFNVNFPQYINHQNNDSSRNRKNLYNYGMNYSESNYNQNYTENSIFSPPRFASKIEKINVSEKINSHGQKSFFNCEKIEKIHVQERKIQNGKIIDVPKKSKSIIINTKNLSFQKKSSNMKEPMDSKKKTKVEKNNEKYKIMKKKDEKCEYCNKMYKDLEIHYYQCEERRLFEIERIRSKQDNDNILGNKLILLNMNKSENKFHKVEKSNEKEENYPKNNDKKNGKYSEKTKIIKKGILKNEYKRKFSGIIETKKNLSFQKVRMKMPINQKSKIIVNNNFFI